MQCRSIPQVNVTSLNVAIAKTAVRCESLIEQYCQFAPVHVCQKVSSLLPHLHISAVPAVVHAIVRRW